MKTEEEKAKAIERANSYRVMMESWAWKDLQNEILMIMNDLSNTIDTVPLDANAGIIIAEARGGRKAFQRLANTIGYIVGGPNATE